jgi:hypothetical protein
MRWGGDNREVEGMRGGEAKGGMGGRGGEGRGRGGDGMGRNRGRGGGGRGGGVEAHKIRRDARERLPSPRWSEFRGWPPPFGRLA